MGYSVIRLMATDADADPNGAPFTWEVINQPVESRAFTLDQDGSLRLATNKLNHKVTHFVKCCFYWQFLLLVFCQLYLIFVRFI